MAEKRTDTIRDNWRCFLACGFMLLSPMQYGLDFGLVGGLQAMPGFLAVFGYQDPKGPLGWNISTTRQQLITSLMTLGAFISSGLAGVIGARLGRRHSIQVGALLCAVANIIMMTTTDIGALYAGRLLLGISNGFFMTFSQLYIQETSPAKYRGLFFSFFQFCTSFGTLLGTIIDWSTAKRPDKSAYLIPLGLIYVLPAILFIGMFFIPESPRWLILQDRFEEGQKSVEWLRPSGIDPAIEATEIRLGIEKEHQDQSGIGFLDMFRDPINRRRTILSVCALSLQGCPGSMFVISYKAYFLGMAKVKDPFAMSNILSACSLIAIIGNALIVVRYGRRRILLTTGLLLAGCCQLLMAVVYDKYGGTPAAGRAIVALTGMYFVFYTSMVACYSWLVAGEIPSQRLRSYTLGFSSAVGFLFSWVVTFTTPYFINPSALNWGPRYGNIWFPASVIAALWTFFFLPETYGRTLEEINQMFNSKVPARKFRFFQCIPETQLQKHEEPAVQLEIVGQEK